MSFLSCTHMCLLLLSSSARDRYRAEAEVKEEKAHRIQQQGREKEKGEEGDEHDGEKPNDGCARYTHMCRDDDCIWRGRRGLSLCADGDECDTERHADAHGRGE